MNFKITLNNLATFLNKVTKVLVPLVTVSLLLGIIFGTDTPYVGDVYNNLSNILNMLGEDSLLVLVSLVIILSYFNIKKD
tara:strand:+ start:565 stop:804 length:240 start_codon:yes stop_codon:yes gene_type:complete